jgi:hypothetical protein
MNIDEKTTLRKLFKRILRNSYVFMKTGKEFFQNIFAFPRKISLYCYCKMKLPTGDIPIQFQLYCNQLH